MPYSRESYQPRDWTKVSCTAGRFFTIWATREREIEKVIQSCPTLCTPMDYRVHGILQTRILRWVAFPLSRWSSQPRNQTQVSHTAGRFFINWAIREALLLMIDACFLINPTGGPHSQCVNHNMQSLWPWGQERGCLHHNPPWQPQRHRDRHRFPVHSELNKGGSNEKQQLFCHENSLFHLISSSSSEVNTISPSWFSYYLKIGSSHTYTHTVSGPLFHWWQSLQTVITFYPLILLMYFSSPNSIAL